MTDQTAWDAGSRDASPGSEPTQQRTLKHGAGWSFVNTLVTKLAAIAVTVVVIRIVSPRDFGVFAVALVVYTIVSAFAELGLSACIARRDMDPAVAGPVVTALSMISYFTLAAGMALTAGPIATALGAPEAEPAIRILSISICLSSFTAVSSSLLVRDYRQGRLFAANAIAFVPANLVLILLAFTGNGALAFAWSRVVGQAVAGIVVITATRPWYGPRWNRHQAATVLRFGLPLAGANLMNYMLLNADIAFIGALLGPTLLGIYTLAFNVASWSTSVLGGTINGVAMPAFSALRRDPEQLQATLVRWSRLVSLVAFPVSVLTAVLSTELVGVLYGPKWIAAGPVLAILAVYGGVFVVSLLLSNLLVGIGRTSRVFIIQAVWLGTLLPSIALGVAWFGVVGAALAHVAVILLIVIPTYLLALRPVIPTATKLLARATAKPFFAALAGGGAAYLAMFSLDDGVLRFLVGGAAGLTAYLLLTLPLIRAFLPTRVAERLAPLLAVYSLLWAALTGRRASA
jgi:PST family polysaccharide transporter